MISPAADKCLEDLLQMSQDFHGFERETVVHESPLLTMHYNVKVVGATDKSSIIA